MTIAMKPALTEAAPDANALAAEILSCLTYRIGKDPTVATQYDWLSATIKVVRDRLIEKWIASTKKAYEHQSKRVYYLSLEFLIGRLMRDAILALNAGSSSVKFGLYDIEDVDGLRLVARGTLDEGSAPKLVAKGSDGAKLCDIPIAGDGAALPVRTLLGWIDEKLGRKLVACGHRIVHGGRKFADPVQLTPPVLSALDELTPLAPLHQPRSLAPVCAVAGVCPGLFQVGCFDTAFHQTQPHLAQAFALPRELSESGIRRYGFHGLSYDFVSTRLREVAPDHANKRIVIAHLGNGASLCAINEGRSVATTMGFTAVEGLMMGTRCGSIDPGVLIYRCLHGRQMLRITAEEDAGAWLPKPRSSRNDRRCVRLAQLRRTNRAG